ANQKILKDWPNLARYHDENAKLPPAPADEKRVVFMGDSITDGWGRKYGKFFPGKPYVNREIGGQTTPQMLLRFRPGVIPLAPKAVVILAGANDIAGNTGGPRSEHLPSGPRAWSELTATETSAIIPGIHATENCPSLAGVVGGRHSGFPDSRMGSN